MTSGPEYEIGLAKRLAIEGLFEGLPTHHPERFAATQSLRAAFYEHLARSLQTSLNEWAKSIPQTTWEERKELATQINGVLRSAGLALVCPKTSKPAILIADVSGGAGRAERMRFRFQTTDDDGKRHRSATYAELPDLELTRAPSRVENFAKAFSTSGRGPAR